MLLTLWAVGWAFAGFGQAEDISANYADDAMVMLSLKRITSFAKTELESAAHHQSAEEVRDEVLNSVFADTTELDQLLKRQKSLPAGIQLPNVTYTTASNTTRSESSSWAWGSSVGIVHSLASWLVSQKASTYGILASAALAFCCMWSCIQMQRTVSNRQKQHEDEDGVVEIWQKETQAKRLRALFSGIDDVTQSDDSPEGCFTEQDLHLAMSQKSLREELEKFGIAAADCSAVFKMLDRNDAGFVHVEEFIRGCTTKGILPPPR